MAKTLSIFHFAFLGAISTATGQASETFTLAKPSEKNPTNTIAFSLPMSRVAALHQAKGEKLSFNVRFTIVNGDTLKTKHIHIRGTSSSHFRRKSLNIKLSRKASFFSR